MRGIGRTATARFAADPDPLARVGNELHANKVVLGSIGIVGNDSRRLGVDVQLVIVATRAVLWAQRFETTAEQVAAGHTDIGLHVVNAVRSHGDKPDALTARFDQHTRDPAELALLGWNDIDRQKSPDDLLRARRRFETALQSDPDSLIALNGLAASYLALYNYPTHEMTAAERDAFAQSVARMHHAGPDDATGLLLYAGFQLSQGHPELALPAIDKAIGIVPSYANGYAWRAQALLLLGRTAEVSAVAERAMALAPRNARSISRAAVCAAEAALMLGDNTAALELARRGTVQTPWNARAHAVLAAAEAVTGNARRADEAIAETRKLWPAASIARYERGRPSSEPAFVAQRQRLYAALRQAGLPEH